ncbi:3-keto-5-aminohexanoate cleavage protein [Agrobacterium tumefaciens]|uniref:3-keto-5-aminohexanoate cleavage protein n=1 Tax=Agrobacterium fabrum TaxID=1176649 RepID=UPI001574A47C|nr:3-keto-5-aminohexanoate cleavage protein [Agrobacterium fabrum]NTE84564.1 3-keto-5-aminohexanoate cleavage protein [Agrobacterium tumefaciens]
MQDSANTVNWSRVGKYAERENISTYWRTYGMPAVMSTGASNVSGADQMPRWKEPPKAIISAAINGAFFTKAENPNQAITPEEIIRSAEGCIAEGAQIVHVHARDDRGYNVLNPGAFGEVLGHLRNNHPDVAFDGCLVAVNDEECASLKAMLKTGLLDAVPVNTTALILGDNLFVKPPHAIIEKTRLILEAGLTPQIAVYTDGDIDNARRLLIDSKVVSGPLTWLLLCGLPGCTPMYSSESMVDALMRQVRLIREVDPEAIIMVCAGGRASSHVATLALLLGLHIRVGMEDTVWKWPHRDDLIEDNASIFRMMRDVARTLGRELMSGGEYRALLSGRNLLKAAE